MDNSEKLLKIVITMPVYNEANGLRSFVDDLFSSFIHYDLRIHITDDGSRDGTKQLLKELCQEYGSRLTFSINQKNLGHGPSVLSGVSSVLKFGSFDFLITVDGDGCFLGADIVSALEKAIHSNCDILEGIRNSRSSPIFRKLTTKFCQILVNRASDIKPKDANTPLRIYRSEIIEYILSKTAKNLLIPNLYISALSRLARFNINEFEIPVIESRSLDKNGSTWKQRFTWLPSKKFFIFCYRAYRQWVNECSEELARISEYKSK